MQSGTTRTWIELIETMTGLTYMDTTALREYFAPLEEWLDKYNKNNSVQVIYTMDGGNPLLSPT